MLTVPIDGLYLAARYLLYGLVLLMPITLLAGARFVATMTRDTVTVSSLLLTIRLFLVIVLLAVFLHVITLTGHIQLICDRPLAVTCQRQRTLVYGLFKQENALDALNPSKEYKTFRAQDEDPYQLVIRASGQAYLLHPAHQFSRLEQVIDGQNRLLTMDDAIADMQTFQRGDTGNRRHYRDRVGLAGSLMTALQVIALLPMLLGFWLFSEVRFGKLGEQRR